MKTLKIEIQHNKAGYEEYDEISFNFNKPFIIEHIKNIKKNIGIIPRINEVLITQVAKDTDNEDVAVYYIKSIEYYDFMILFVLDEDSKACLCG